MYHGCSFADIDEDGKPEITIGCYDNHVYVLNAEDGSLRWSYPAPYYVGAPTSIADLNNDDHLEIVFASWIRIGALSHTGSLLWSYTAGEGNFRGAAIADVDGNGILDVAFGADDGILRVLTGDSGKVVWTYNLQAHYGNTFEMDHAPVIADFNGDGKLDVFVVGGYGTSSQPEQSHGRAYALTAGEGEGPGWPMFRHDLRHSGCFGYAPEFICGDANGDGIVTISDVVYLVNYLYKSGSPPSPLESGDANGDGPVDLGDVVFLLNYLFKGGSPPSC